MILRWFFHWFASGIEYGVHRINISYWFSLGAFQLIPKNIVINNRCTGENCLWLSATGSAALYELCHSSICLWLPMAGLNPIQHKTHLRVVLNSLCWNCEQAEDSWETKRMATSRVLEFWMAKLSTLFKKHCSPKLLIAKFGPQDGTSNATGSQRKTSETSETSLVLRNGISEQPPIIYWV